jgi:hypothetical protein
MKTILRTTGEQHALLVNHLFPGDGKEAVAVALCGRRAGAECHILAAHEILPIPYDQCRVRAHDRVEWSTELIVPLLEKAMKHGMAVVKIHSHLGGPEKFSPVDDVSDRALFDSVYGWTGDEDHPHASAIMLPDGKIFGRVVSPDGEFTPLSLVSVAGDDLHFWRPETNVAEVREFTLRHAQAFGERTTAMLGDLTIAVIGVSGTGMPVVEMISRLGVRKLVPVDPDIVEKKNTNRLPNTTAEDVLRKAFKVDVAMRAIKAMGFGTIVQAIPRNLWEAEVVKAVAEADIVFGCVDSVDGRYLLNRLATFYCIPYFDVGVKLQADGHGGIEQVCGTVHYLQPGRSSLLSRRVFTLEEVRAAGLKRTDPEAYKEQVKSKYIVGAQEDRPAVISVNFFAASLAVNEFLARLHPYRDDENGEYATHRFSLSQGVFYREREGEPCGLLTRYVGRGDMRPLLNLPELSDLNVEVAA